MNIGALLHLNGQPFQCHAGAAKAAIGKNKELYSLCINYTCE